MKTTNPVARRLRSFLALPALGLLMACPPVEPPGPGPHPDGGERLRSGLWSLALSDIQAMGPCGELEPGELEGLRVESWLDLEGRQATLDMDGLVLRGSYEGRWLDLEGTVEDGFGVIGVEDEEVEDEEALPGGEDEEVLPVDEGHRDPGLWVSLEAEALAPDRLAGVIFIDYDRPELRCSLSAELRGDFLPPGDRDDVAEPGQDEPRTDDGDWDEDEG